MMAGPSDRELWNAAASGSDAAFGRLFERHATVVYNYCFRRVADWATAEDLMAATFLEAWRRRKEVRLSGESLRPWLLGVATNLVRNHWRSNQRRDAAIARLRPDDVQAEPQDDLVGRLDDQRRMAELLKRIRGLPDHEQEALVLVIWSELSYQEAAVALGVPVGTVKSRLSRARAKLGEPCPPHGHEPGENHDALARDSDDLSKECW